MLTSSAQASVGFSIPITKMFSGAIVWRGIVYAILMAIGKLVCGLWLVRVSMGPSAAKLQRLVQMARRVVLREGNKAGNGGASTSVQTPESPLSLYPGLILGSAMMSRGEIGYLISSLAESGGVFSGSGSSSGSGDGPSDMFLIATWAITLCTVAGPITMGLLVDRVRKLEEGKASGTRGTVLGQWGPS